MPMTTLEDFLNKITELDKEHQRIASDVFKYLKQADADLAALAVEALGGEEAAALWFVEKVYALGDRIPLALVAQSEREIVIDCLNRIKWSMYA